MRPTLRFLAARGLLRLILSALFEVRVSGGQRLPGRAHILACNHLSWLDPFLVLAYLPARPRIHYLGRRSAVFNRYWKRWAVDFVGGVLPVEAGQGELAAVTDVAQRIFARGGVLGVFPEGRLGEREGELQELRRGVTLFAHAGHVPVVPVGLAGTHELWLRRPIRVQVGMPIELDGDEPADLARLSAAMLTNLPGLEDGRGVRRWRWLTHLLR